MTAPLKLYQYPRIWGRNVSPFTLKLETWLRLASVPFENIEVRNPGKGPKGKLPAIEDQGRLIGDSTLIIDHLKHTRGVDLDEGLDARAQAEAVALQRLFEDHLYWAIVYSRWLDPEGFAAIRTGFFADMPPIVRDVFPTVVRTKIRWDLRAQGLGRHTRDEVYALARADLQAVADGLEGGPWFLASRPTTLDAIAYGHLANIALVPIETELKAMMIRDFPRLVAYCHSMEAHLARLDENAPRAAA